MVPYTGMLERERIPLILEICQIGLAFIPFEIIKRAITTVISSLMRVVYLVASNFRKAPLQVCFKTLGPERAYSYMGGKKQRPEWLASAPKYPLLDIFLPNITNWSWKSIFYTF